MKALREVVRGVSPHWVGDGFPVRSLFGSKSFTPAVSPFLMLDYAGPYEFSPGDRDHPRGVGEHPHRGFETVTIVYEGELAHADSAGHEGRVGKGDVQWMTAASGVLHQEFHTPEFSRRGGLFEVMQLWVNLPHADKMSPPKYQEILAKQIPTVDLGRGTGSVRVIAGKFQDVRGPAKTFTPVNVWDVQLAAGVTAEIPVPEGYFATLAVRRGALRADDGQSIASGELAIFDRAGAGVTVECDEPARLLFLSGEPIDEPIVAQGPFVMNSREEILEAYADFRRGRMGSLV